MLFLYILQRTTRFGQSLLRAATSISSNLLPERGDFTASTATLARPIAAIDAVAAPDHEVFAIRLINILNHNPAKEVIAAAIVRKPFDQSAQFAIHKSGQKLE